MYYFAGFYPDRLQYQQTGSTQTENTRLYLNVSTGCGDGNTIICFLSDVIIEYDDFIGRSE